MRAPSCQVVEIHGLAVPGSPTQGHHLWNDGSFALIPQLVLPEYSIHSLFCIMFLCAQEWLTLGLNVPLLFYHFWRYFHCPADSSELAYDPPVVMNADTLSYCQKEAWCKLAFYLLSFFYYLYCKGPEILQEALPAAGTSSGPHSENTLSTSLGDNGLGSTSVWMKMEARHFPHFSFVQKLLELSHRREEGL
ncbi:hypothetical protein P7K49_035995 [Saguinus oedipus]|uniref:Protein cornichon homolog 3 n=1 Tax=Saguinus oedipus TaxID=9490 RepID=A0ABQ9TP68_SAGOE|nr:hypothetical protein P7K49_035995 [Saguinus oedipus]